MLKPIFYRFDWDDGHHPDNNGLLARVVMEASGALHDRTVVQYVDTRERAKAYVAALNDIHASAQDGHPRAFHWTQGLFFKRAPDASVWLFRWNHKLRVPTSIEIIDEASWASIVCSVSAGGETGERWSAARDFHGRPDPST